MKYFILLNIFPADIVNIIFNFIIEELSSKIIKYSIFNYCNKKNILIKSVNYLLNNDNSIKLEEITNLSYVMNTKYSELLKKNDFWCHYLNLFSMKLMSLNNNIYIINQCEISKDNKRSYKYMVKIWYKMCKKFDIYLKLGIYKNNNISKREYYFIDSVKASEFEIKNFSKFATTPLILFDSIYPMDQAISKLYLSDYNIYKC
jgi:hypothetical protein